MGRRFHGAFTNPKMKPTHGPHAHPLLLSPPTHLQTTTTDLYHHQTQPIPCPLLLLNPHLRPPHVVTIMWCNSLLALGLHISISTTSSSSSSSCKVDMRHDTKHFLVDDAHPVHVYWDLKNSKFFDDPEPLSDYYVALISDHQVVILLGDLEARRLFDNCLRTLFDTCLHLFAFVICDSFG
ncbi:uncharacterized protein A4U43_C01F23260 [Asparagus officinalis]|uniref:Uncharacterized protein n=1 Tax=Asparagus officinalis TaxID=4686 RepID=A0A5P1FVS4_ASPOF|nr:uncharacterized protein A4U43_C01F23260 [Asparagus officinalis]